MKPTLGAAVPMGAVDSTVVSLLVCVFVVMGAPRSAHGEERPGADLDSGGAGAHAHHPAVSVDPAHPAHPVDPDPGVPASAPPAATGDAEAAPAAPPPPPATGVAAGAGSDGRVRPLPARRIAIMPRFAYRLGDAGRKVTPASGYGVGGTIDVAYLRLAAGLEAALGIDFSYDRFATSERGIVTVNGEAASFASTRVISETSFVLVHTAAARWGPVRPYLCLGAGVGIGFFDSAALELRPGTRSDTHALGRASVGVDIAVARDWSVSVRADYTAVRATAPLRTDAGATLPLFGDLFDLAAGVAFRF